MASPSLELPVPWIKMSKTNSPHRVFVLISQFQNVLFEKVYFPRHSECFGIGADLSLQL